MRDIQDELRQQRLQRESRDIRPSVQRESRDMRPSVQREDKSHSISAELREVKYVGVNVVFKGVFLLIHNLGKNVSGHFVILYQIITYNKLYFYTLNSDFQTMF